MSIATRRRWLARAALASVWLLVSAAPASGFGYERTFGSPGSGVGQLGAPNAVGAARAPDNRVFVVETGNARVQRFNADGTHPFVFPTTATGGGGGQKDGQLYVPQGIAVADDEVYVADTGNNRVQVFSLDGAFKRKWGIQGAGNGQFDNPGGIAVVPGATGLVYVADTRNHRVQVFTKAGQYVRTIGGPGSGNGQFQVPLGVAVSADHVFVSDENQERIQVFAPTGAFQGALQAPKGVDEVAVDAANEKLYAAAPLFPGQIIRYSLSFATFGRKDFTFTAADQPGSPAFNGHGIGVSSDGDDVYMADGSTNDIKVFGECDREPEPGTVGARTARTASFAPRPVAGAAAVNEVRAVSVQPSVTVHRAGTPEHQWCRVTKDTVLKQGDEISVDPDGAVTLQFADNSTVVVRDTTQLKIASFFTEGGVVKTEILLKMGQVAAKVHKSEATRSDFRIKSPTGVASTRATAFSVFYDAGSKAMVESTTEHTVKVDPAGRRLKTVFVPEGKEVEVIPRAVSKLARIGKAGARGGINRVTAIRRVEAVLAKNNGECKLTTAASKAFAAKPAPKGWKVAAKVAGKVKGTSKWKVRGGRKASPANPLAKRISNGCG